MSSLCSAAAAGDCHRRLTSASAASTAHRQRHRPPSCRVPTPAPQSRSVRPALRPAAARSAGRGRCRRGADRATRAPGTRKNFSNTRSRSSAGMPGPFVGDRDPDVTVVVARGRARVIVVPGRRVLAGVVEQDVDHFGRSTPRRPTRAAGRRRARRRRGDRASPSRRACSPARTMLVDVDRAQVDRLRRLGPIRRRQPLDEAVQAIRLLVDHLQQLAAPFARQLRLRRPRRRRRISAVTAALIAVSGVRRLCVSASSSAALSCSLRRAASASLARSNARLQLLIQPLDLLPPRLRFGGAPLGARRQLAGDHRRDDEGDERDPVLGVFDAEAGRRQEVVRIGAGAGRGRDQRRPGAPQPRDDDDVEQEQRRGDAGVADRRQLGARRRSAPP